MKNKLLLLFLIIGLGSNAQKNFFKKQIHNLSFLEKIDRQGKPISETLYTIDVEGLRQSLNDIGNRENGERKIFSFPDVNGKENFFEVFEASVMEPEFQTDYPNIRSFAGQGITNPQETIRFTLTQFGFQAIILGTDNGTQHIKPLDASQNLYTSFLNKDLNNSTQSLNCQTNDENFNFDVNSINNQNFRTNDGLLRSYRIAIAATAEYSAIYNNNLSDVIASMVIAVSSVNAVFERELSVNLILVDNSSIIFFDPNTDPYDNFDNQLLVDQNPLVLDANIGSNNYDIGHVFNTLGGGLAGVGVLCNPLFKAAGVTGLIPPQIEAFIYLFLHELGHQFGSLHTFNGDEGVCEPNRSEVSAVEPGSGSTIMGYAGLCGSQNVPWNGDIYYHGLSLNYMSNHILSSVDCPFNETNTGNNPPTANAGLDYTIPQGTPYKLNGSSSDVDGTLTHTYTWEQFDLGPPGVPTENTLNGPLVRSFLGTTTPSRYIPKLEDLLVTQGSTDWEKLSTVDRDIDFLLYVRDNDVNGGQYGLDDMKVTVTTQAGPFKVTSQNGPNSFFWTPGSTQTVTWNVAGTNGNGVNEDNVNILLSVDEGQTFDLVLASNVPNNGSYDISVPNLEALKCRIMVQAADNIFFNINEKFFPIGNYSFEQTCEDYVVNTDTQISELFGVGFYTANSIAINENINITDLNISVNISGDADNSSLALGYSMPSVEGFNELITYPCLGTTGIDINFDDQGAPIDCNFINSGGLNSNVIPQTPLSLINNANSLGTWTLFAGDHVQDGLTSTLNSFTISICGLELIPSLSINEFLSQDSVSIYPNPSSGIFNIEINSQSSEDINIQLFDIIGRLIYNKQYASTSDFQKSIDLNEQSSGVYILKISQGNKTISKKLVLE